MKPNFAVVSLSAFDRGSLIVSTRISINGESAVVDVDFKNHTVVNTGWGEGNKFADALKRKEMGGQSSTSAPPRTSIWELAGQFARAMTDPDQVGSYLRAVGSRRWLGPVSLPVLDHRHQCCHGTTLTGVRVSEPCRHRHETDRGVFCKECGCVEWQAADIRVVAGRENESKLACPDVECPKERWAAMVNEHRFELEGANHG